MFPTKEPILKLFENIESDDHQERVLFYEEHTYIIFTLDDAKQNYFAYHYINSLFKIGKYDSVLNEVDSAIEYVFFNDINYLPERSFEYLLFLKASALSQMLRYEEAINIGTQLLGMHPKEKKYVSFLKEVYREDFNFKSSEIRLIALILILVSAIACAILWLSKNEADAMGNFVIFLAVLSPSLLAIILMFGSYIFNSFKSIKKVEALVFEKSKK